MNYQLLVYFLHLLLSENVLMCIHVFYAFMYVHIVSCCQLSEKKNDLLILILISLNKRFFQKQKLRIQCLQKDTNISPTITWEILKQAPAYNKTSKNDLFTSTKN